MSRFQSLGYDKDEQQGFSQNISDMISVRNIELCSDSGNNHNDLLIIYSANDNKSPYLVLKNRDV